MAGWEGDEGGGVCQCAATMNVVCVNAEKGEKINNLRTSPLMTARRGGSHGSVMTPSMSCSSLV